MAEHNLMAMTNISLDTGASFDAISFVQSQKIRSFAIQHFSKLFETLSAIVTPTTACLAPRWHLPGADMNEVSSDVGRMAPVSEFFFPSPPQGISDTESLFKSMLFIFLANFIGSPALTVVSGYADNGLPIGFHIMSRPFCEEDALILGEAVERNVKKTKPAVFFDLLGGGK